MKTLTSIAATAVFLCQASISNADDITYGIGISWTFDNEITIGARIFSDDEKDTVVASLGVDYNFGSNTFRPIIGAAYLGEDVYGELNLGYDFDTEKLDYGIGVGYVNTEDSSSDVETTPAEDTLIETDRAV